MTCTNFALNCIINPFTTKLTVGFLLVVYLNVWILPASIQAQTYSRNVPLTVTVNQVGFTPGASKMAVMPGEEPVAFEVRQLPADRVVYRGTMQPTDGRDFGESVVGDFSSLTTAGTYYIHTPQGRSYPFDIAPNVYESGMNMILDYFAAQRCGPSTTGYLAPCHLDDGVRKDNGQRFDGTGGWHDASDLRKGVESILTGAIGLVNVLDLNPHWRSARIVEELHWGNKYFLNVQEPEGYLIKGVGSQLLKHADTNYWSNNRIEEPDGPMHNVESTTPNPRTGRNMATMTVMGTTDDRIFDTIPARETGQFRFVVTQAKLARLLGEQEPQYAEICLSSARRCFEWAKREGIADNAGEYAAMIDAAVAMYETTADANYRDVAVETARKLLALQQREGIGSAPSVRGFFFRTPDREEPHRVAPEQTGYMAPILIGLTELIEAFPEHPDAPEWKEAVSMYARDYVTTMAGQNAFGISPIGFWSQAPGGDRRVGPYWYRYFQIPQNWWVGINANLAATGVGLVKAARILDDPDLIAIAQRQLDWILGNNPFNSSTFVGLGYNQPQPFINGGEFWPPTPTIVGAVMNGHGGTMEDEPRFYNDGEYHVAEYWTPMVAYTFWLMAELHRGI